jgi:hypothetical protein
MGHDNGFLRRQPKRLIQPWIKRNPPSDLGAPRQPKHRRREPVSRPTAVFVSSLGPATPFLTLPWSLPSFCFLTPGDNAAAVAPTAKKRKTSKKKEKKNKATNNNNNATTTNGGGGMPGGEAKGSRYVRFVA